MQFIATAQELHAYTVQKTVQFPKRYKFATTVPLCQHAETVCSEVIAANSIRPGNQHEAQLRRDCFIRANCSLMKMVQLIELADGIFGIEDKIITHWIELIHSESKLIAATMKNEIERYKDLPG